MDISVIIPTRDRAEMLDGCLRSLAGQHVLEILVIDDGSTDDTRQVAHRHGAVCVSQPPSGLNAARNRGVAEAKGQILVFVDDDIYASEDWASAIADAFRVTRCDALGGKILLHFETPKPKWLHPKIYIHLSGQDFGDNLRPMTIYEIPIGANCAVTRTALQSIGGFTEGLDREGTSLLSNGDKDFFFRLHRAGGRIIYAPKMCVHHRVPASRLNKRWFRRRVWWQGISDSLLLFDPGLGPRRGNVYQTARELVRITRTVPILGANLIRGIGPLNAELWALYCLGRLVGIKKRKP